MYKWGLKVFDVHSNMDPDEWNNLIVNTEQLPFRTVKDIFNYLGFRLPRVGYGYVGFVGEKEYLIEPYGW